MSTETTTMFCTCGKPGTPQVLHHASWTRLACAPVPVYEPSSQAGLAAIRDRIVVGAPPAPEQPARPAAPDDLLALPDLAAMLELVLEDLDTLHDQLVEHRRNSDDPATRRALTDMAERVTMAWASARIAMTDLQEQAALDAVKPL